MTLEQCSKLRDEIAARVAAIQRKWDQERTVDGPAIRELQSYCKRIRPLFAGRYGNVGGKISQMTEAVGKVDDRAIGALIRALKGNRYRSHAARESLIKLGHRPESSAFAFASCSSRASFCLSPEKPDPSNISARLRRPRIQTFAFASRPVRALWPVSTWREGVLLF